MRLGTLLADLPADYHGCTPATEISGLAVDSRRAAPGLAFLAVPGLAHDGHAFIPQAAAAGAAVLLLQRGRVPAPAHPHVWLPDTAAALPQLAARSFGEPAQKLRLAGVTGTNGKTTVTYLVAAMLRAAARPHLRIGTAGNWIVDHEAPAAFTTSRAVKLPAALFTRQPAPSLAIAVTRARVTIRAPRPFASRAKPCTSRSVSISSAWPA